MSPVFPSGKAEGLSTRLWRLQGAQVLVPKTDRSGVVANAIPTASTRPLLWTGLRQHPARLSWRNAPAASSYTLRLANSQWVKTYVQPRSSFEWPAELTLKRGDLIRWTISCTDRPEEAERGEFWILDADAHERLENAERIVAGIENLEMRAFAQALTSAEFGLYDDAINIFDTMLGLGLKKGRVALLHRLCITILTDMKDKAPSNANGQLRQWTSSRIAVHFTSLQSCLPAGMGNPAMLGPSHTSARAEASTRLAA